MSLTRNQKIGIALGFIPLVSIPVGIIKAYAYYQKLKEVKQVESQSQKELENMAQSTDDLARAAYKNHLAQCEAHELKKIIGTSIVEVIPGINLIAALAGLMPYHKLSRDETMMNGVESFSMPDYLQHRYHVNLEGIHGSQLNFVNEALELIYLKLDPFRFVRVPIDTEDFRLMGAYRLAKDPSLEITGNRYRPDLAALLDVVPLLADKVVEKAKDSSFQDGKTLFKEVLEEELQERDTVKQEIKSDLRRMGIARSVSIQQASPYVLEGKLRLFQQVTSKIQNALDSLNKV